MATKKNNKSNILIPQCKEKLESTATVNLNPENVLYITAKIGSKFFPCLVDTGASVTIVDTSVFNHPRSRLTHSDIILMAADGNNIDVLGKVITTFSIGPLVIQHNVYVCKNIAHPVILGCDFLISNDISIHPAKGLLAFNQQGINIPTRKTSIAPRSCHIIAIEDICIPAGKQLVINVAPTDNSASSAPCVVEPRTKRNGLAVSRSIDILQKTMFILAINTTENTDIKINKGEAIAYCTPLDATGNATVIERSPTPNTTSPTEIPTNKKTQFQISEDLTKEERESVQHLLEEYDDLFSSDGIIWSH